MLQQKRGYFKTLMSKTRFESITSYGNFQIYRYKNISEEKEYDDMSVRLVKVFKVAMIPVIALYKTPTDKQVLRFCFSKIDSTLEAAAEKLVSL